MNRTTRTITIAAIVLSLMPAAAAAPAEDPLGSLIRCAPPVGPVPWDASLDVGLCGEIEGGCTYSVVEDRLEPHAGGTGGVDVRLDLIYSYGYSTWVHCTGAAELRTLQYGTLQGESRGVDLRLGLIIDDDVVEGSPAAKEAAAVYGPGVWAFLELSLEFEAWAVYRDAVPASGTAAVAVPIATYNSAWVPQLWATDAIAPPADVAIEREMTRSLTLIHAGTQESS